MKRLLCLFLSTVLIFCLVSCSSDDGLKNKNPEEIAAADLLALVDHRAKIGYDDNAFKITVSAVERVTVSGQSGSLKTVVEILLKETATEQIASVVTTASSPGAPDAKSTVYFKNGYLYSVSNGVTNKTKTTLEETTDNASVSLKNVSDIIKDAKETKYTVEDDGTYKISVKLDPKSDNEFADKLLSGINSEIDTNGENITVNTFNVVMTVNDKFFLDSLEMRLNFRLRTSDVVANMYLEILVESELLGPNYKIPVPSGFNIDKATEVDEL